MENKPMKILIIEDDVKDCEAFIKCAKERNDIEIVAITDSDVEGLKLVKSKRPEGIVLDLELNNSYNGSIDSLDFLSDLKKLNLSYEPIVIVTTHVNSKRTYDILPYEFSKLTGRRNFRMLDGRGEMLACADSLWVYMDAVRKRPCRLEEDVAGAYTMEPRLACMEYEDGHIQIPENMTESALLGDVIYPEVKIDKNGGTVVLGDQDGKPYAVIEFR